MKWQTEINDQKILIELPHSFVKYEKNHLKSNEKRFYGTWNDKINSILFSVPGKEDSPFKKVLSYKNIIPVKEESHDGSQVSFGLINRKCHFHISLKKVYPGSEHTKIISKNKNNTTKSPITGRVLKIIRMNGEVHKNDTILIIEAMKMENKIKAPKSGILEKIHVKENAQIKSNDLLFTLNDIEKT